MECTGERYMPEFDGDWTLEHTHRYLLARELAPGKNVLDIACGDGYGAHMLADIAANVVGVDIFAEAVTLASVKYKHPCLSFVQGSATDIPLADNSVDLVTSFETIEHITEHEVMLKEIRRVLRPDGILIMSSPDKHEYSDLPGYANPYHLKELYRDEFINLLKSTFTHVSLFGQRITFGSLIAAEDDSSFISWRKNEPDSRTTGLSNAEYFVALASAASLPFMPSSILKNSVEQSDCACNIEKKLQEKLQTIQDDFGIWKKESCDYISLLEYQNKQFENQIIALKAEKNHLAGELAKIYVSRSWRVTSPLRFGAACARRAIKLCVHQSADCQLSPVWPPDVHAAEKQLVLKERPLSLEKKTDLNIFKVGVFLHIYYVELIEEILTYLHNVPQSAYFHVSTDTEEKRDVILQFFAESGFASRTEVRVCQNQGWDIAPFLIGFADVIPNYQIILRLHSKRSTQLPEETGNNWREMLFDTLCGDMSRVNSILRAFEDDPKLGMICPPIVAHNVNNVHFGGNFHLMHSLLSECGVHVQSDTAIDFPVGSMFWCRSEVLAPWLERHFSYDDFIARGDDERDGSLAHALERLFFFGCAIKGFSWARL